MIPLALALAVSCAQAAPAPRTIAAPSWSTIDVKPELASFYSDHLAVTLREDGFKVITQSEIAAIIGSERQAELLGCTEAAKSCMAELANALGADLTLIGSIAKLEDTYRLHLKLIKAHAGAVLSEVEVEAKGEKAVLDELIRAGHRLTEPLRPAAPRASLRSRSWIAFGGAAVCVVAGAFFFAGAADRYDTVKYELTSPMVAHSQQVKSDVSAGKGWQLAAWITMGVGVAAAAAGVAMVIFGAPAEPAAPVVRLSPSANGFVLSGSFW